MDDGTKCRIAPHGNEDNGKENLSSDSASVTPLAFRIFLSIWAAFLQTGPAQRDVYVRLPQENGSRFVLWHLKVATYGLVNTNAKWTARLRVG